MFHTPYRPRERGQEVAWRTSWDLFTRMVGGLIMTHGDDNGLRVPPRLAPVQAVVLAVKGDEAVLATVRELGDRLTAAGIRGHVDDRTDIPFGRRAVGWELKGVPVRVGVGPVTWRAARRCWPGASRAARSRWRSNRSAG